MKLLILSIYFALCGILAAAPVNIGGRSQTSGTADTAYTLTGTDGTVYLPSAFASGSQGALAQTALQSATSAVLGLTFTRNGNVITLTGTSVPYANNAGTAALLTGTITAAQVTGLAGVAYTGAYSALVGAPTALPALGGTATTITGTLTLTQVSGALAATGGSASNITINGFAVSGTMAGPLVRSGTTAGGVYVSPTITTPSGLVATDIGGTSAVLGSNNAFQGTNNTAPNQIGQIPADSTLIVKAQSDALYPALYMLLQPSDLSASSTTAVNGASVTLPAGTYKFSGNFYCITTSTTAGMGSDPSLSGGGTFTGFLLLKRWSSLPANINTSPTLYYYYNALAGFGGAKADPPATAASSETHGWFKITSPLTLTLTVRQFSVTDSANPVIMKAGSGFIFERLPGL